MDVDDGKGRGGLVRGAQREGNLDNCNRITMKNKWK